ncbi:hypothetical protein [Candidatus Tisiphia endosymbiont of Beris chalybata]|uniref:hypothetical protein n=1 Tax=Candidatus Tisiphia endosymbiont of Beris chalybata TaxID=3066262 RepID=UPI00312CBC80
MTAQSKMGSLTNRSSELNSQEQRQSESLTLKWAQSDSMIKGFSFSENQAIKESILQGQSLNENYGSSERKETSTSTNASLGLNLGVVNAGGGVGANNSKTEAYDTSASKQKAYNDALEKVKSAQRDNRISTSNDEVRSLGQDLISTWNEQQSVSREIAKTTQTMQQLSNQRNYVESNSATIDRNMNEPVLQAIIARNIPGVTSKEQAARWASHHSHEAMNIAQEVVGINKPLPQSNWNDSHPQVKDLQSIDSIINNTPMTTQEDLKTNYLESNNRLQEQATVTDSTGASKALAESVKSDLNKGKKLYSQNVDEILDNQLSSSEREKAVDLEITTVDIKDDSNKLKEQFDQTSNSTIVRTAGRVVDNMRLNTDAIKKQNITLPLSNNKDNKN